MVWATLATNKTNLVTSKLHQYKLHLKYQSATYLGAPITMTHRHLHFEAHQEGVQLEENKVSMWPPQPDDISHLGSSCVLSMYHHISLMC